jgi:predicted O-methyltransferase YrrM
MGVDTISAVQGRANEKFLGLVELIRAAGTDNLSHFGCGYTHEGGLSLQQNPFEFAALCVLLSESEEVTGGYYLEIGSASGGAALMLDRLLGFEKMWSIDDGGHHRYPELPKNFAELPHMDHLKADSHGPEARAWLREKLTIHRPGSDLDGIQSCLDVVFIDGDHSEHGVWQDVQLVRPHLRIGTLVILHDIVACGGVKTAWERGAREQIWTPVAEYIGPERPLGIGVGMV